MKNISLLRNEKGQGMVEFVLLAAISVGLISLAVGFMQKQGLAQKLLGNPWTTLSGMIECGAWSGCKSGNHPNSTHRIQSYRPGS